MGQSVSVTGMVLNVMPIGDYDKRITILTMERGKITAFARGARRPNSQLLAATNPFSFGTFEVFEGRSSYNVSKASITNYFRELTVDYDAAYYGFYFLEFADYFCQENNEERQMLKLLYQSLRALESPSLDNRLVRLVFELKAMTINGLGPGVFSCMNCGKKDQLFYFSVKRGGILCTECREKIQESCIQVEESTAYTMQYVVSSSIEKLYTFTVTPQVFVQLQKIMKLYMNQYVEHSFKSLRILEEINETKV